MRLISMCRSLSVDVEIMIRAAIDAVGLAFMSEEYAAPHLASGALVRVPMRIES